MTSRSPSEATRRAVRALGGRNASRRGVANLRRKTNQARKAFRSASPSQRATMIKRQRQVKSIFQGLGSRDRELNRLTAGQLKAGSEGKLGGNINKTYVPF